MGNECGDCETIHCIGSEKLKGNVVFLRRILGIKPSLERPQLDTTGVWYDSDSKRISFVMNRVLGGREKLLQIHVRF